MKPVLLGDKHFCPKFDGNKPHAGGPVTGPGASSVLIEGKVVSVIGDDVGCKSVQSDKVVAGIGSILIEKKTATNGNESTAHGGKIFSSCETVSFE